MCHRSRSTVIFYLDIMSPGLPDIWLTKPLLPSGKRGKRAPNSLLGAAATFITILSLTRDHSSHAWGV